MTLKKFILIVFIVLGVTGYLLIFQSEVTSEYLCEGEMRYLARTETIKETARVKISDYRFWVGLWSDDQGYGVLASKEIPYAFIPLKKTGNGNFATYAEKNSGRKFLFRKAMGEVLYRDGITVFNGRCKLAD